MNEVKSSDVDKHMLGTCLIIALVLGGGTSAGLGTDTVVQLVAIVASTIVIMRHMDRTIDRRVFWLMVAAGGGIVLQLLPVSFAAIRSTQGVLPVPNDPELAALTGRWISLGPGRTLEVAAYFATLCLFLTAVMKLRFSQAFALIPFFLAGAALNLTAGLVQYSFEEKAIVGGIFAYDIWGGFFANPNHFSTLIFISIPLAFTYLIYRRQFLLLLVYLIFALVVLFAAGSKAGVAIGSAVTVLSALVLVQRNRIGLISTLAAATIVGILAVGIWARVQVGDIELDSWRAEAARTTFDGFLDNFLFGVGYGNFVTAYPSYERVDMIFDKYVNHAHNEYLELLFEGGAVAGLLLLAFFVILGWRIVETLGSQLHKTLALAVLFVLVHSAVDYPLRTLAIAFSFALLIGLLFHHGRQSQPNAAGEARVDVNGEMVAVPMTGN